MTHKLSILLVEDEKNICDFISTSLSAQDYRISTAHTGKEALPIITSQCPDLILLDLGLPDMDGMEIIRQVRTWSSVPIIVLSARTQEQEKVRALDLGADDYLTKPIGTSELLARIRTGLRLQLSLFACFRYICSSGSDKNVRPSRTAGVGCVQSIIGTLALQIPGRHFPLVMLWIAFTCQPLLCSAGF